MLKDKTGPRSNPPTTSPPRYKQLNRGLRRVFTINTEKKQERMIDLISSRSTQNIIEQVAVCQLVSWF